MQTRDFVSGLHKCLSNSLNTLPCLDQALQTRGKRFVLL